MTITSRARALAALTMLAVAAPAAAATATDDSLTVSRGARVTEAAVAPRGVFDVVLEAEGTPPVRRSSSSSSAGPASR
jgi:hypothetical protein